MDLRLQNRTALVTGAHRGTGRAIAHSLAREGVRVVVHGHEPGEADSAVADIRAEGGEAYGISGVLTTDEGALAAATQAHDAVGAIDILVNNYGTADAGSWARTSIDGWIEAYEKNVLSIVRLTKLVMDPMKQRGWGRIIMLGTIGSTEPAARMPAYYAAKGALHTMTVSLAKDLARTGVTVNLVSPGLIRTREVEERFLERGRREGWGQTWEEIEPKVLESFMDNLTGHIPRTEEVADFVCYLASPRADAITATNFRIDGGSSALAI